jgi:uncharacterized membrane protein YcaP (DUF421 family)
MEILGFDIAKALTPDVSIFETIVRGIVVYVVILVLIRYAMRGQTTTSMPSLIVIVLIADAAQNAMASTYNSITNGLVLVATIVFTSQFLNWAGRHSTFIENLIHQERRPLIINGRIIRKTLANELMSEDELLTQLRLQGVDDISQVKASYLEGTGDVSVIKKSGDDGGAKKRGAQLGG